MQESWRLKVEYNSLEHSLQSYRKSLRYKNLTRLEAKMTPSRRRSTWAHPTRLDLTWLGSGMSTWVDFKRLETFKSCDKFAWTLYVYCRLFIKCFILSADAFCYCHLLKEVRTDIKNTLCYVIFWRATAMLYSVLASLSSVRLYVCRAYWMYCD